MGTEYKNDSGLGDYIVGNATGSRYNTWSSLGADHAQNAQNPISNTSIPSRGSYGGGSYTMLPIMEDIKDAIPSWLLWIVATLMAIGGLVLGLQTPSVNSVGTGAFVLFGGIFGYILLPFIVLLLDFLMQLLWVLFKLALGLAVLVGVFWVLSKLFGQ